MKSRLSSTIWTLVLVKRAGVVRRAVARLQTPGACPTERPCWILARCPAALAGR